LALLHFLVVQTLTRMWLVLILAATTNSLAISFKRSSRRTFIVVATTSVVTPLVSKAAELKSDEFDIVYNPSLGPLGLYLEDVTYGTALRVQISRIDPSSQLLTQKSFQDYMEKNPPYLSATYDDYLELVSSNMAGQPGLSISAVNKVSSERTNARGVLMMLNDAAQAQSPTNPFVTITLKSSSGFNDKLAALSPESPSATTNISPVSSSDEEQNVIVTQLRQPQFSTTAKNGDLVEISYTAYAKDDKGAIFSYDTSKKQTGDVTILFVLGKQPFGQFPPAFNIGVLNQKIGEVRRIEVPGRLSYVKGGKEKEERAVFYDVKLVSVNSIYN